MPRVVVYTRDHCSYCTLAKQALYERGIRYHEVDLTRGRRTAEDMEMFKADAPGAQTLPQILAGGRLVGGWDDLAAMIDTPAFQELIGGN